MLEIWRVWPFPIIITLRFYEYTAWRMVPKLNKVSAVCCASYVGWRELACQGLGYCDWFSKVIFPSRRRVWSSMCNVRVPMPETNIRHLSTPHFLCQSSHSQFCMNFNRYSDKNRGFMEISMINPCSQTWNACTFTAVVILMPVLGRVETVVMW